MLSFARRFDEPAFLGEVLYDIGLAERKARNLTSASASFREAIKYSKTYRVTRFESKESISNLASFLNSSPTVVKRWSSLSGAESLS